MTPPLRTPSEWFATVQVRVLTVSLMRACLMLARERVAARWEHPEHGEYETWAITNLERAVRRLVPVTSQNLTIIRQVRYMVERHTEPPFYALFDWEAHSDRTKEQVLAVFDAAIAELAVEEKAFVSAFGWSV